jgi:hypothetical protein
MTSQTTCKGVKAECMNNDMIKSVQNILELSKKNPILDGMIPLSNSDIKITESALKQYQDDCRTCAAFGNAKECMEASQVNLRRNLPFSANNIYPWRNYDWNYSNHTANNYSTKALPAGGNSVAGFLQSGRNVANTIAAFIDSPSPSPNTNSNIPNQNSDYPVFECKNDIRCISTERVRRNLNQKAPTTDSFLKKNLQGENSSSFYYKVGICRRPDIKTQGDCENRGYTWSPDTFDKNTGFCRQPRYAFINNTPKPFFNGSNSKGPIPSIANDIRDIMPDKLFNALMGQSTDALDIQECPIVEGFIGENDMSLSKYLILLVLLTAIPYILYKLK